MNNKLLYFLRIFFREIDIGVGMSGVGDGPESFWGGFGIIKAIDHFCGDVCAFFAMDEEE
jgi:hypothetical protein